MHRICKEKMFRKIFLYNQEKWITAYLFFSSTDNSRENSPLNDVIMQSAPGSPGSNNYNHREGEFLTKYVRIYFKNQFRLRSQLWVRILIQTSPQLRSIWFEE